MARGLVTLCLALSVPASAAPSRKAATLLTSRPVVPPEESNSTAEWVATCKSIIVTTDDYWCVTSCAVGMCPEDKCSCEGKPPDMKPGKGVGADVPAAPEMPEMPEMPHVPAVPDVSTDASAEMKKAVDDLKKETDKMAKANEAAEAKEKKANPKPKPQPVWDGTTPLDEVPTPDVPDTPELPDGVWDGKSPLPVDQAAAAAAAGEGDALTPEEVAAVTKGKVPNVPAPEPAVPSAPAVPAAPVVPATQVTSGPLGTISSSRSHARPPAAAPSLQAGWGSSG